jgi:hypothetical protein
MPVATVVAAVIEREEEEERGHSVEQQRGEQ